MAKTPMTMAEMQAELDSVASDFAYLLETADSFHAALLSAARVAARELDDGNYELCSKALHGIIEQLKKL